MKSNNYNLYAFILGRETKIALLELESVLRRFCFDFTILSVIDNIAIIKFEDTEEQKNLRTEEQKSNQANEAMKLIKLLGGTIKIFEIVGGGSNNLIGDIAKIVQENTLDLNGKLNLGISDYRATPTATSTMPARTTSGRYLSRPVR